MLEMKSEEVVVPVVLVVVVVVLEEEEEEGSLTEGWSRTVERELSRFQADWTDGHVNVFRARRLREG
jgi:hypothetical protein